MINWRNAVDEKPKDGEKVVCCMVHWKLEFPASWEIMGGEFWDGEYPRVETLDASGHGSYGEEWNDIDWWLPAEEAREFLPTETTR